MTETKRDEIICGHGCGCEHNPMELCCKEHPELYAEPKWDEAMEVAVGIIQDVLDSLDESDAFYEGHQGFTSKDKLYLATEYVRPHLAPRPVLPEEVERVATELAQMGAPCLAESGEVDTEFQVFTPEGQAILQLGALLLRTLAGENSRLKAGLRHTRQGVAILLKPKTPFSAEELEVPYNQGQHTVHVAVGLLAQQIVEQIDKALEQPK